MKKFLSFMLIICLLLSCMGTQSIALNTELLSNTGFEGGSIDPFYSYAGSSEYEIGAKYAHSGSSGLYIKNRQGKYATYAYDVLPILKENGSGIYKANVWVRLKDDSQVKAKCQLVLNFQTDDNIHSYLVSPQAELSTTWKQFSFYGFIDITDDIKSILMYQQSFLDETAPDVYVDDFSLIKVSDGEYDDDVISTERSDVTTVGAIRWDAWYTHDGVNNSVISQVERSLSPSQFHFRAPFFAEVTEDNKIIVPEFTQAVFDREMEYAKYAGIDYFAYVWYNTDMKAARKFHEQSIYRNDVKMCSCFDGNAINKTFAREEMAYLLKQDYYMTVLDGRPLMYYFASSSNITNILNDIIYYEQLAEQIGVNKPFAVILNVNATAAKAAYGTAVSSYAVSGAVSFDELTKLAEDKWLSYQNAKFQYVPPVTFGWQPEPRYINPVTWTNVGNNSWSEYATDTELLDHLAYALSYMQHDAVKEYTMANTVLAYAWNEHDEGGWICPTLEVDENGRQLYNPDGTKKINENRINAVKAAIDFYKSGKTVSVTVNGEHNGSEIAKASDTISDLSAILNNNVFEGKDYYSDFGEIVAANVDIGSSLTLNYYVKSSVSDLSMRFTSSGKMSTVKGVYDEETGYYKFRYTKINPQCMADNVAAELIYQNYVIDTKNTYSIKKYCEDIIYFMDGLSNRVPSTQKLKTLFADMLAYCIKAQDYTQYNRGSLTNSLVWINNLKSEFSVPTGVRSITGNTNVNYNVRSIGLSMENVNRLYFKLNIEDSDIVITLNDKNIDLSTLKMDTDGCPVLFTEDITAANFDKVYTLKLIKDGSVLSEIQYNVNAYITEKYTNAEVGEIVKALSNYGSSAKAYTDSLKQ